VTAVLVLGAGSALLGTEVHIEVPPAALELVCPTSVRSDESLKLGIRNRGGSALEATYSILALGEEPAQGGYLPSQILGCPFPSRLGVEQSLAL
jgi:polycystin 1